MPPLLALRLTSFALRPEHPARRNVNSELFVEAIADDCCPARSVSFIDTNALEPPRCRARPPVAPCPLSLTPTLLHPPRASSELCPTPPDGLPCPVRPLRDLDTDVFVPPGRSRWSPVTSACLAASPTLTLAPESTPESTPVTSLAPAAPAGELDSSPNISVAVDTLWEAIVRVAGRAHCEVHRGGTNGMVSDADLLHQEVLHVSVAVSVCSSRGSSNAYWTFSCALP